MSSTPIVKPAPTRKSQARKAAKVLRSQKQPAPEPKPTQTETVTLASGEHRSVIIGATNDKEWNDLVALAEGATAISLDQKDITHRAIGAIAALRVANEDDWKRYCERRGMKWRKEAKSAFQSAVMWVLNRLKTATGENHTSKASMIAGCLDEYWEIQRPLGMKPNEIAAWLGKMGGYTAVYRDRLDRLREPKDKIAERYGRYLALQPLEQRDIPDWLDGFDGEVVVSAHINRRSGKLEYRSVWRPEGGSFWYSRLDRFIAARPDYGKAVEPVRCHDAGCSPETRKIIERIEVAEAGMAEALTHQDEVEVSPSSNVMGSKALDQATRDAPDSPPVDLDAGVGDFAESQVEVGTESADSVGAGSNTPPACELPRGCRYGGCIQEGRCLGDPEQ
jgi:hypothetical protein